MKSVLTVSLLAVLYVITCKLRKIPVDLGCLKGLAYTIWAFIMVALSVLVITLVERPSISEINIEGNNAIKTEDLLEGLKGAGLAVGQVFQRAIPP